MKKFKIGGKKRPFLWGIGAIEIYCDIVGGDLEMVDKIFTSDGLQKITLWATMMYAGAKNALPRDSREEFNLDTFKSWIDQAEQSECNAIIEDYTNSLFMGRTVSSYYGLESADDSKNDSEKK